MIIKINRKHIYNELIYDLYTMNHQLYMSRIVSKYYKYMLN